MWKGFDSKPLLSSINEEILVICIATGTKIIAEGASMEIGNTFGA